MVTGAQIAQHMANGLTQGDILQLRGLLMLANRGMRLGVLGVFLLPHARQRRLTLVFRLLCGTRTQHLLLREHHSTTLGRRQITHTRRLPRTNLGILNCLGFRHLIGLGHRFHLRNPFRLRVVFSTS